MKKLHPSFVCSTLQEICAKLKYTLLEISLFRGRPRTHWRDYVSGLAWECVRVPQEELDKVVRQESGLLCLGCCPRGPT